VSRCVRIAQICTHVSRYIIVYVYDLYGHGKYILYWYIPTYYGRRLFIFPYRFRRKTACRGRSNVSRDYITDSTRRKYTVVVVVATQKLQRPDTALIAAVCVYFIGSVLFLGQCVYV